MQKRQNRICSQWEANAMKSCTILCFVLLLSISFSSIACDSDRATTNEDKQFIFSGISIFHPDFFQQATIGRYSITPMMRHLTDLKQITGEMHPSVWFDIGSPAQLKLAEQK